MSPARRGTRPTIETGDILEAVNTLGVRWTMLFGDEEITSVNEALDRELLAGNLTNAFTVSARGLEQLDQLKVLRSNARFDLRIDSGCLECRLNRACWVLTCTRCHDLRQAHIGEDVLTGIVQDALSGHDCPGRPATDGPRASSS